HRDSHARLAGRRRVSPGRRRYRRRLRPGRGARGVPQQAARARGRDRARGGDATMMLLIDNYDSFTYNLAHLFGALGVEVRVVRNDELTAHDAEQLGASQL